MKCSLPFDVQDPNKARSHQINGMEIKINKWEFWKDAAESFVTDDDYIAELADSHVLVPERFFEIIDFFLQFPWNLKIKQSVLPTLKAILLNEALM